MIAGYGSISTDNRTKKQGNNRGVTMVTVVVSFALLLLFVTGFYRVQRVSQNMMMNSKDLINNNHELVKEFYLGETTDSVAAADARLNFGGSSGGFYIDATLMRAEKEGLIGTVFYYQTGEQEN